MTPTPAPIDPRLDRLFVRYWENTLTPDEAVELNIRLAADPAAREWFRWFCTQAAFTAEWAAVRQTEVGKPSSQPPARPVMTRRRALVGIGGLAAAVGGVMVYRRTVGRTADTAVTVTALQGLVITSNRSPAELQIGSVISVGETIAPLGTTSSVVLSRPDGSSVTLSSGSAVQVADQGDRLVVTRGGVSAELRPPMPDVPPMVLGTSVADIASESGAIVGVSADNTATEVQVQHGEAQVSDPAGSPLSRVHGGEQLTVHARGGHTLEPIPEMPERFALDLRPTSPVRWPVGSIENRPDGAVLTPHYWHDPYHGSMMYQIRTNSVWTRGIVRLWPDSQVAVRYRAEQTGRGQACLVVRQMRGSRPGKPQTGVLEWNGDYQACLPGQWRTVVVRAADMLNCKEAPAFGEPWVAFLLIFNTYDADIGLCVADLRVSRPGGREG